MSICSFTDYFKQILDLFMYLDSFIPRNNVTKKVNFFHTSLRKCNYSNCKSAMVLFCKSQPFLQKQPPRAGLRKSCSENMQQICRRTPMPKCDSHFTLRHVCSHVNLLRIFRTSFPKNTSGRLLLLLAS